ncbi:B3/B4 domain-containing protein [Paludifilum halophilum]|uniref:B3/B4 tRNA-binding domain-containing protein n=1 Tax=Paludifilum halophilum TaxID=1642702 RepID=A0A235B867_9BACL|nr:phenylalanine--tRNA ligase beta subunit-related protein [Paludifilum halophilum]OYD08508.1 hypothetical protein CHM34_06685 [Paludifilum halophilum]
MVPFIGGVKQTLQISVDPDLKKILPSFLLGIIHYEGCDVGPSTPELGKQVQIFTDQLRAEYTPSDLAQLEAVRHWREAFKRLGTSPSRYRPSSESLLRRVVKGGSLSSVNSAVDLNNYFSLKYLLPLGIYNRDSIQGSIRCGIGAEEDSYTGVNGREVSMKNKLLLQDDTGPFGSPYVDSRRTQVTEETERIIQAVFAVGEPEDDLADTLTAIGHSFVQIHGGQLVKTEIR